MNHPLEDLLFRIHALQEEVEDSYRQAREELERQRLLLSGDFLRWQHRHKIGLIRFILSARPWVVLTAPIIYLGWIPFLLLDLFITVYQGICFPIYHIPKVNRTNYLIFDREQLAYLNLIERFNCFYCAYGNGVSAYAREVAARTEQYWCPIKHARRVVAAHDHYPKFFDHGDAETYRRELQRLRLELDTLRTQSPSSKDPRHG